MKRFRTSFALPVALLLGLVSAQSAWPANVTVFEVKKGTTVTVTGDLAKGTVMADLAWASTSSMACFPATQNAKFRGNHVFFATQLPPRSEMTIKIIPKDPTLDLSGYAYTVGTTNFRTPPQIQQAVSCEAEHKWDRPKSGKTQDHTRDVPKLTAIQNPYNVFIGVSGPKESMAGEFSIEVTLK
jgi:hypothetical protein